MSNTVAEALREHLRASGLSQKSVAKAMGISSAAVSQYLNNKYPGDIGALENMIAQYLNLSIQREAYPHAEIGFIDTSVVRQVCEILHNCHVECRLGIVTGDSGLGKTTGVKRYAAEHSDVIVVYGRKSMTCKSLMVELATKIGVDNRGSKDDIFGRIWRALRGSKRMLIIDEAEHLKPDILDQVRRLGDSEFAGIGIALVGLPRLSNILRTNLGDYQYIYRRVRWSKNVPGLSDQDIKLFVSAGVPQCISLWQTFADESMRNARLLVSLIENSIEVAVMNSLPITSELIHEAAKLLMR